MKWVVLLLVVGSFCHETVSVSVAADRDSVKAADELEKAENLTQNDRESGKVVDTLADSNKSHSNESEALGSDLEASKTNSSKSEDKVEPNFSPVDEDDDEIPPFPVVYSSSSSNSESDEIVTEKIEAAKPNAASEVNPSVDNSPTDFLEPNSPWIQQEDANDIVEQIPFPVFNSIADPEDGNKEKNEESDTDGNQSENENSDEKSPSADNPEPKNATTASQTHSSDGKSEDPEKAISSESLPPNKHNETDGTNQLGPDTKNTTVASTDNDIIFDSIHDVTLQSPVVVRRNLTEESTSVPIESDETDTTHEIFSKSDEDESLSNDKNAQKPDLKENNSSIDTPAIEIPVEKEVLPSEKINIEEKSDQNKPQNDSVDIEGDNTSSAENKSGMQESRSDEQISEENSDRDEPHLEPKNETSVVAEETKPRRQSNSSEESEEKEIEEDFLSESKTNNKIDSSPIKPSTDILESRGNTTSQQSSRNSSNSENTRDSIESTPVLPNDSDNSDKVETPTDSSHSRNDKGTEDSSRKGHTVKQKPQRLPSPRLLLIDEDDASSFYSCVKHSCHDGFVFNPAIRTCEQADVN